MQGFKYKYKNCILRQELNCKLFFWEVTPEDASRNDGIRQRREGSREMGLYQRSSHLGHLGLSPSGDLWDTAVNRHPPVITRGCC